MIKPMVFGVLLLASANCGSVGMREPPDVAPARVWAPVMHGARDDLTWIEPSRDYPLPSCIVSGLPLDSMGGRVAYEDRLGREVQFCCADCAWRFVQTPRLYQRKPDPLEPAAGGYGEGTAGNVTTSREDSSPQPAVPGMLAMEDSGYCPVLREVVDGKTFVEWNGLRFGLCCRDCVAKFQATPAGILENAGIDWKAATAAEKAATEAKTQQERENVLDDLRCQGWEVVREPPPLPRVGLLIDLDNDICPTDWDEPDGKAFAEWNGLRIGFCCPSCVSHLWAHPESVLEHAGIEWKEAAAAVKKVNETRTDADRWTAMVELCSRWKVLRDPGEAEPPVAIEGKQGR